MYFDISVSRNPLNINFCYSDDRHMRRYLSDTNNDYCPKLIHIALRSLLSIAVIIVLIGVFELAAYGEESSDKEKKISKVNQWRFYKGNQKLPREWTHLGFDDRTWRKGQGKFGYGYAELDTLLSDMRGGYSRLFVRSEFIVNPRAVKKMDLSVICDGPFIAYINGIEVARSQAKITETLDISGFAHELLPGNNVLAVECTNDNINSNHFLFVPSLAIYEE